MDKYFYLLAQMPFLSFGIKSHMDRSRFLEEAKKWEISRAMIEESSFMVVLRAFEDGILEQAAAIRAGTRPSGAYVGGNPLEIEKNILRARWDFIEEQSVGHHFDIAAVGAYFAKLGILEEYFIFNKDSGLKNFDQICEAVL